MKMERLLRSPLVNAVVFLLIGATMLLVQYEHHFPGWLRLFMAAVLLGYVVIWTALVLIHNRRHPDRRIRLATYMPPEFREEDEGQQWMNYRATRRVYIMYYAAIPFILPLIMLLPDGKAAAIAAISLLGVAQQLMYWWELRKWDRSDPED